MEVSLKKSAIDCEGSSSSSCPTAGGSVGKNVRATKHTVPTQRTSSTSEAVAPANSSRAGKQSRSRRNTGSNSDGSDAENKWEYAGVMSTDSSSIYGAREREVNLSGMFTVGATTLKETDLFLPLKITMIRGHV